MSIHIPTLEQAPLLLRAPTRDDIGTLARILQHQPSRNFGERITFERAFGLITDHVSRWVTDGLGFWSIIKSNDAIGMVGFSTLSTDIEIDIALSESAEGQGIGTLACQMVLGWLKEVRSEITSVEYCVDEGNDRAHALAQRLDGEILKPKADPFGGTTTDTWYRIGLK